MTIGSGPLGAGPLASPQVFGGGGESVEGSATVAVGMADALSAMLRQLVANADTIQVHPALSMGVDFAVVADVIQLLSTAATPAVEDLVVSEGLQIARSLLAGVARPASLQDGIGAGGVATAAAGVTISEAVELMRTLEFQQAAVVTLVDAFRVEAILTDSFGNFTQISDVIGVGDEFATNYGMQITDRLRFAAQARGSAVARLDVFELVQVIEQLRAGVPITIGDSVAVGDDQIAAQGAHLRDAVTALDAFAGAARYNISIAQAVRLLSGLAQFVGADMAEGLELGEGLLTHLRARVTAAEEIGLTAQLSAQLIVVATAADQVELEDLDVVRMMFSPTLRDGVELRAGYVAPNGGLTTWTMNTRTGAVTEYQNFEFNSFAQLDGRYVGASETGLYELLGDDDAGTSIIARIKSGFMQFGGTRLSRLSAAYIAARGEGDFVLRVVTGDGAVYNYAATSRDMRSMKVHMGKGQRARYFAFELISAGQDFDLDTLEFVPVLVQRRV